MECTVGLVFASVNP